MTSFFLLEELSNALEWNEINFKHRGKIIDVCVKEKIRTFLGGDNLSVE